VAFEASILRWLAQLRVITGAVYIVAVEASHTVAVHHALHIVISLHAVLCEVPSGKWVKEEFAQLVIFQLPKIAQALVRLGNPRAIVIFSFERLLQWLALRMALDAGVVAST